MPMVTVAERDERRQAIARLLREHTIEKQSELVDLLRAADFPATQSSVSRDLQLLKVDSRIPLHQSSKKSNSEVLTL